jgi:hypothetical protein
MLTFFQCNQATHMTTQKYLEHFNNVVDVIENSGGSAGSQPGIAKEIMVEKNYSPSTITIAQCDEGKQCAQQQYLATTFVLSADHVRYVKLIEDL